MAQQLGFFFRKAGLLSALIFEEIKAGWTLAFFFNNKSGFFQDIHETPGMARITFENLR